MWKEHFQKVKLYFHIFLFAQMTKSFFSTLKRPVIELANLTNLRGGRETRVGEELSTGNSSKCHKRFFCAEFSAANKGIEGAGRKYGP